MIMRTSRAIILLALLTLLALVGTAVFVYLPVNVTINSVSPPVIFQLGSNAGGTDLAGNTIQVTLGANSSSATLILHPTYQRTYYHDVLLITNPSPPAGDNYYIGIRVITPLTGAAFASATARVYDSANNLLFTADLMTAGTYGWPQLLPDGQTYRIDIEIVINEGFTLPSGSVTFELVYSPQSVTPPP